VVLDVVGSNPTSRPTALLSAYSAATRFLSTPTLSHRGSLEVENDGCNVLRAFIDDSGSGGDSTYYVLSGYIADIPTWESFSRKWKAVCDSTPSIQYFKMSEAESLKEQFGGFSDTQRSKKVQQFIDVIRRHGLFEISCAIPQDAYNNIVKLRLPRKYRTPYFFCFGAILSMCAIRSGRHNIDFVFDRQEQVQGTAKKMYEQSKHLLGFGKKVENIDYGDDKVCLPLQAADLIAWQTRRFLCAEEGVRKELKELHQNGLWKRIILRNRNLEQILSAIERGVIVLQSSK
jgi:uncharacterized protein DUF3800